MAFLGAVNVGSHRRVGMDLLSDVAARLGHEDVWTYANSGNVVFAGAGRRAALESSLEQQLETELGFDVMTCVRSQSELRKALEFRPFRVQDDDTYFITFLKKLPTHARTAELEALGGDFDTIVVSGRDVHWRMRGKSIDTEIPTSAWEGIVGEHMSTSRNTNMLHKLVKKMGDR